jgi:hypothetical protein
MKYKKDIIYFEQMVVIINELYISSKEDEGDEEEFVMTVDNDFDFDGFGEINEFWKHVSKIVTPNMRDSDFYNYEVALSYYLNGSVEGKKEAKTSFLSFLTSVRKLTHNIHYNASDLTLGRLLNSIRSLARLEEEEINNFLGLDLDENI